MLLLLFSIGLDLDIDQFKESAKPGTIVATGGVILPFLLGYFTASLFGYSNIVSFFIGASLVATSVGISAAILQESGKLKTKIGTTIIDSAVIDDLSGILIMTVLFGIATTGSLPLVDTIYLIFVSILFFAIPLTVGSKAIKRISRDIPIQRENLILAGIAVLLAFGFISQKIGLEAITGAFLAGLMLGQTHFSSSLAESITVVGEGFLIPIFFITMGMKFNLSSFASVGLLALVLIAMAVIGKIFGSGIGAKLVGYSSRKSLTVGVAMLPRAEVALIIAHFGFRTGILDTDLVSTIVLMAAITTLITPPLLMRTIKEL